MCSFFKYRDNKQKSNKSKNIRKAMACVKKRDCIEFLREYHRFCDEGNFKSHILDYKRTNSEYIKMMVDFKVYLNQLSKFCSIEEMCYKTCIDSTSLMKIVNNIFSFIDNSDNSFCLFLRKSELYVDLVNSNPVIQYRKFKGHEVDVPDGLLQLFLLISYRKIKNVIESRYKINLDDMNKL